MVEAGLIILVLVFFTYLEGWYERKQRANDRRAHQSLSTPETLKEDRNE